MNKPIQRTKLLALGFFAFVLLNFPFLSMYNKNYMLGGVPVLYVSLFFVWVFILVFLLIVLKYKNKNENEKA